MNVPYRFRRFLGVAVFATAFGSLAGSPPRAEAQEDINLAVKAALRGPELQKFRIQELNSTKTHRFNIKPLAYHQKWNCTMAWGQLSHYLANDRDDQLFYVVVRVGNQVDSRVLRIKEGGLFAKATSRLIAVLEKVPGDIHPVAEAAKQLGKFLAELESEGVLKLKAGDWQSSAARFLQALNGEFANYRVPFAVQENHNVGRGNFARLYDDANRGGRMVRIGQGSSDRNLRSVKLDDKITSVEVFVPNGQQFALYKHKDYGGSKLVLGPGRHLIQHMTVFGLENEISSVRWEKR